MTTSITSRAICANGNTTTGPTNASSNLATAGQPISSPGTTQITFDNCNWLLWNQLSTPLKSLNRAGCLVGFNADKTQLYGANKRVVYIYLQDTFEGGYVQEQFVGIGMVADICLHDKKTDRGSNPHAHILLTLRDITPDGFGAKRRDWNDKALVTKWREAWATACNKALAESGSTERIDHRSNKARGIDAPATVHTGRRTPWNSDSWDAKTEFNAWVQTSIELAKVQAEVKKVQSQIIDLTSTLAQAIAERDAIQQARPHPKSLHTAQRIWTPAGDMPRTDFSIERLLSSRKRCTHGMPHAISSQSTPPPDVSHGPDGQLKGDKPC